MKNLAIATGGAALLTLGLAAGLAAPPQPDLENALASLRAARRSLIHAAADKSGHRLNAIKMTDQAIAEVQASIDAR